jgi:hypothetical protein
MRRSSGGAITALIDWLHYADPALAPMRRSSIGSYTAIRDISRSGNHHGKGKILRRFK